MWEEILDKANAEREFRRQDSEVTVSTVETFVSVPIETNPNQDSTERKAEEGKVNVPIVPRWKILWWKYSEKLVKYTMIGSFILGVSFLLPGYLEPPGPIIALQIVGILFCVLGFAMFLLQLVIFLTSKDQREAPLPYSGFNTFTPGVSWGKVFAKQREN